MRSFPFIIGGLAALVAVLVARHTGLASATTTSATWLPATKFRSGRREAPSLVVLHSTNGPVGWTARQVAEMWAGAGSPATSSHYVVGPNEVFQSVREDDEAWCAGTQGNRRGIHIELLGRSWATDWLGDGRPVLERAARLAAQIARRWGIPVERRTVDDLKAGRAGFTTHAALTTAFGESTHDDPGGFGDVRWPWTEFLAMVREA